MTYFEKYTGGFYHPEYFDEDGKLTAEGIEKSGATSITDASLSGLWADGAAVPLAFAYGWYNSKSYVYENGRKIINDINASRVPITINFPKPEKKDEGKAPIYINNSPYFNNNPVLNNGGASEINEKLLRVIAKENYVATLKDLTQYGIDNRLIDGNQLCDVIGHLPDGINQTMGYETKRGE